MKRRGDIAVELTPLLDVILIMLFMIMSQSSEEARAAKEAAAEESVRYEAQIVGMQEIISEDKAQLASAAAVIESYRTFDEHARIVSIAVENVGGGGRSIYLSVGEDTKTINFGWDNMKYGENSLKAELERIVRDADDAGGEPVFIVFTYDSGKVFRRDYDMIASVMDGIQSRSANVYIKYNERTD